MRLLAAMEPERRAFLCELYNRSAGDACQGVSYEVLIEALGFEEAVTKRLQGTLQREGWVELTTVPAMTHMGRPVMNFVHRHYRQQTIRLTPQGVRLMEEFIAMQHTPLSQPSASPDHSSTI